MWGNYNGLEVFGRFKVGSVNFRCFNHEWIDIIQISLSCFRAYEIYFHITSILEFDNLLNALEVEIDDAVKDVREMESYE